MRLILVTAPTIEPLLVQQVREHLRIDGTTEDALLYRLITVAREALDGRDGLLGRALLPQTWQLLFDRFTSVIELPLPPLISVNEIGYVDPAGAAATVSLDDVVVDGAGDSNPATLRPRSGFSWPSVDARPSAVNIKFTCGYASFKDVPAALKQALLMHIAHMYENRESTVLDTRLMSMTPQGYDDLVNQFRIWSFG